MPSLSLGDACAVWHDPRGHMTSSTQSYHPSGHTTRMNLSHIPSSDGSMHYAKRNPRARCMGHTIYYIYVKPYM